MTGNRPLKTARDGFFFYPENNQASSRVLALLLKDPSITQDFFREIADVSVLLNDDTTNPRYGPAFLRWTYRLRERGNPECLQTREGMQGYLDYLVSAIPEETNQISHFRDASYDIGNIKL